MTQTRVEARRSLPPSHRVRVYLLSLIRQKEFDAAVLLLREQEHQLEPMTFLEFILLLRAEDPQRAIAYEVLAERSYTNAEKRTEDMEVILGAISVTIVARRKRAIELANLRSVGRDKCRAAWCWLTLGLTDATVAALRQAMGCVLRHPHPTGCTCTHNTVQLALRHQDPFALAMLLAYCQHHNLDDQIAAIIREYLLRDQINA